MIKKAKVVFFFFQNISIYSDSECSSLLTELSHIVRVLEIIF